jgi:signal transduction histidine kinase
MSNLNLVYRIPLKYLPDFKIIVAALAFYLSALLGHFLTFSDSQVLPSWPPSGVAFGLIILLGRASWPGIAIGSLVANTMAYWNTPSLSPQTIIAVSSFIAIGQTLEAITGSILIKHWINDEYPFTITKNTFRFLFTTLAMCLVSALMGTTSLYWAGVIESGIFMSQASRWWVGEVVGILLFTPFILAIVNIKNVKFNAGKALEVLLFIASMIGIYVLVSFGYFNQTLIDSLPYLMIPLLLWLAFRFDLLAVVSFGLVISLLAIYYTIKQLGPFIEAQTIDSMLLLQIFIGVISISAIVISSAVTERTRAQNELKEFNTNLENMVHARTRELNEEINTRKNTENKLINTNSELSKRNTELDNFVYSVSHDLRAPIASVLGLINLAKKEENIEMLALYLDKIKGSAEQQDNFIKEILDQSRNSRLEVKKEEILFEPLIEETFNQLKFATSTGANLQKEVKVNQNGVFYSDSWRVKVILNNIISNSIRYRNGKDTIIKVNVDVSDHKAMLEVNDNGRGIGKEHLGKVYQMFYRATDDGAGSGLGLYIVKETIDKLSGQINIESELGKGTTVKMEIPEIA